MLKTLKHYIYFKTVYNLKYNKVLYPQTERQEVLRGDNHNLRRFDEIPGPKSYSVIGTLYKYWPYLGDYDEEALDKTAWLNWRKYGGLVREEPGIRLLHLYEPDIIEAVFRQKEQYPARRSHIAMLNYRLSKPDVHNTGGLLSTNGPDWWRIRSSFQKKMSSPQNAKQYINCADNVTRKFVKWVNESKISSSEDFLLYLNRLYLEVIGVIVFNENFGSFSTNEQGPDSKSSKIIKAAFESNSGIMKLDKGILWRYFETPLYRKLIKSQEYLEKLSMDILLERINFYKNDKNNNDKSLLMSFLELPNIDMKDITGVLVDILMASIDTTSYTTSFVLYHLARNQNCQMKLFEEISSLMPDKDEEVTADILSKATYLKSCIKESLRLNPVSVGVGRVLQNDIIIKEFLIPKDTVIVAQNMVASRLPQYVRDPLSFKPERWMRDTEHYENIHPFLSLPFGFGSRSCIARRLAEQNISIALIRLIREFNIKWMGGDLGVKTLLINKPDQPVSLSFSPRII